MEYLKPEDDEGATINLYGNTKSRLEANADANIHLGEVNTEVLAHYENDWGHHDDNGDKTTPTTLINAFEKFGYKATPLKADDKKPEEKDTQKKK